MVVELGDEICVEVNTRVRALEFLVQQKAVAGVDETVPSFSSLLVYYDPLVVGYRTLCATLTELCDQAEHASLPPARLVELPCCYDDPTLGIDLAAAADRLALPAGTLVRGVSRRGSLMRSGSPPRYGRPGVKPMKYTRYRAPACRRTSSSAESASRSAAAARSTPSVGSS